MIGAAAFLILVVVLGRALARFYIDELWFDAIGQSGVFWSALWARLTLFAIFFVAFAIAAGVNLFVADRLAPSRFPVNVHPFVERFHDLFGRRLRLYRYLAAALVAVLIALPTTTQWQSWLLYRNSQSFGTPDARFGADVGFYVFELPFLSFVLDWWFFAMIIVLVITVITHILNGGVVFASPIPSLSQAMKGHIAVLVAVIAALKGADYWIRRYELTNVRRGFVQGPTYSVVNAQMPALLLLAVVALVTAGLYLSTLKTQAWRIPLVASAVWMVLAIVGGYAYPAVIQSLVVRPNQKSREAPYIEHNVEATRAAMGINDIQVVAVEYGSLSGADIEADQRPLQRVRLLNPTEARTSFQRAEGEEAGLSINDLDVDRYDIDGDGELQQVLIAARELDLQGAANQSWQGRHLIYTHGCGLVMAPASRVRANSDPDFLDVELTRPQIYFSPGIDGWAVAGTDETEQACGPDEERYSGEAGVELSSWVRQAAFGLAFMDYNLIGSGAVGSGDAQMLWNRNVRDRVEKLAPFLTYDGDPYPVQVDGGVKWVIDAYTSTSRYPYAEAVGGDVQLLEDSGIPRDANYIRNSVKAVVDAYDGSVQLYVVDDEDPIVRAWMSAFPDLFTPGEEMPLELREHLRYPEDLFRVQTNVYSKYRLEAEDFFERTGAWSIAQSPSGAVRDSAVTAAETAEAQSAGSAELATESSNARFIPYYTLFDGVQGGGVDGDEDFVLLRPFVPFSREDDRTELTAFMTASSDVDSYGTLTVYVTEGQRPRGPRDIATTVEADQEVTEAVTNVQAGGSNRVRFGDLQLVPVADGLIWARPFYVASQQPDSATVVVRYQQIIIVHNGEVAMAETIGGALAQLFPSLGDDFDVGERIGSPDEESELGEPVPDVIDPDEEPASSEPTTTVGPDDVPDDVLRRVFQLLNEADAALPDMGAYQDKVDEATALLQQYLPEDVLAEVSASIPASSAPTPTTGDE